MQFSLRRALHRSRDGWVGLRQLVDSRDLLRAEREAEEIEVLLRVIFRFGGV